MPTLSWIGKNAVENHHRQVPFHLLKDEPSLSVGDPKTGNLVVEGDNLLAWVIFLCLYLNFPSSSSFASAQLHELRYMATKGVQGWSADGPPLYSEFIRNNLNQLPDASDLDRLEILNHVNKELSSSASRGYEPSMEERAEMSKRLISTFYTANDLRSRKVIVELLTKFGDSRIGNSFVFEILDKGPPDLRQRALICLPRSLGISKDTAYSKVKELEKLGAIPYSDSLRHLYAIDRDRLLPDLINQAETVQTLDSFEAVAVVLQYYQEPKYMAQILRRVVDFIPSENDADYWKRLIFINGQLMCKYLEEASGEDLLAGIKLLTSGAISKSSCYTVIRERSHWQDSDPRVRAPMSEMLVDVDEYQANIWLPDRRRNEKDPAVQRALDRALRRIEINRRDHKSKGWHLWHRTPKTKIQVVDFTSGDPVKNAIGHSEWRKSMGMIVDRIGGQLDYKSIPTDETGYFVVPSKFTLHFFSRLDGFYCWASHPLYYNSPNSRVEGERTRRSRNLTVNLVPVETLVQKGILASDKIFFDAEYFIHARYFELAVDPEAIMAEWESWADNYDDARLWSALESARGRVRKYLSMNKGEIRALYRHYRKDPFGSESQESQRFRGNRSGL